jgi:hypothetical protein
MLSRHNPASVSSFPRQQPLVHSLITLRQTVKHFALPTQSVNILVKRTVPLVSREGEASYLLMTFFSGKLDIEY